MLVEVLYYRAHVKLGVVPERRRGRKRGKMGERG
jgi:hypothetical protein